MLPTEMTSLITQVNDAEEQVEGPRAAAASTDLIPTMMFDNTYCIATLKSKCRILGKLTARQSLQRSPWGHVSKLTTMPRQTLRSRSHQSCVPRSIS